MSGGGSGGAAALLRCLAMGPAASFARFVALLNRPRPISAPGGSRTDPLSPLVESGMQKSRERERNRANFASHSLGLGPFGCVLLRKQGDSQLLDNLMHWVTK